jgi:hypothetical protein
MGGTAGVGDEQYSGRIPEFKDNRVVSWRALFAMQWRTSSTEKKSQE